MPGVYRIFEQEWTWSERYREQPEILRYLCYVTNRFAAARHPLRHPTPADYDTAANRWRVN
jgi:hypothetical protein